MLHARLRAHPLLAVLSVGLSVGLGFGCSLILDPANSDDVIRCTNTDDCSDNADFQAILSADYRLAPRCSNVGGGGGGDIGSSSGEQVCAAIFNVEIGCNPSNFTEPDHPFGVTHSEAITAAYYTGCAPEYLGLPGCRACSSALGMDQSPQCFPGGSQISKCVDNSDPNGDGICEGDGPWPTYPASYEGAEGQDVMDQYCRSYFCSDTFVCDRSTFKCVKCSDSDPYGEGGCGEMYVNGAVSTVYQDADTLDSRCSPSTPKDQASKATEFGPIPGSGG